MDDPTSEITDDHSIGVGGLPAQLDQLKASATQQYSLKNYSAAAELFSRGVELQDEINGEMSPENANLLYQYGRCLYHVAVQASDVLGGKVAESKSKPKKKKRKATDNAGEGSSKSLIGDAIASGEQKLAEEVVEAAVEEKDSTKKEEEPTTGSNPYFQITGDENFTDSEEEDDGEEGPEGEEEEDDDFQTAYEILDMARVLLARKIESLAESNKQSPELRLLRERLADTHDLQAEISLENERFTDAISDTKESLKYKLELYPQESSLVAEAHYKLSLALEFASVTSTTEGKDGSASVSEINEDMRKEAAAEMEKAIASCKARVVVEEKSLSTLEGDKKKDQEASIADVKDMVGDMEQRLSDLRKPAASLSAMQGEHGDAVMQGVLGAMLGESKGEAEKRLKEATAQANDLTGLVKKKKVKAEPVVEGKGKRKAVDEVVQKEDGGSNGKKAKVEDA